jgi:hypothetical protein
MPTPPPLHVAQKGTFNIFKCKKHGETLAKFILGALILSIVDSLIVALPKGPITWVTSCEHYH